MQSQNTLNNLTTPAKRKAPRTAWKKGQSGNPGGRPKQIFFTTKPFKQALMRELQQRSVDDDQLQRIAARLIDEALICAFPMTAIKEIANRLDGTPEKEPAPPQQNTMQTMMGILRSLNLTQEQRDVLHQSLRQSGSDG